MSALPQAKTMCISNWCAAPNLMRSPALTWQGCFCLVGAGFARRNTERVWPSEYGIDPTGLGGLLGLAEMGEIKSQLAEEAEADLLMMEDQVEPQSSLQPGL